MRFLYHAYIVSTTPIANVIGFSGEIFISLITWKTYNSLIIIKFQFSLLYLYKITYLKWSVVRTVIKKLVLYWTVICTGVHCLRDVSIKTLRMSFRNDNKNRLRSLDFMMGCKNLLKLQLEFIKSIIIVKKLTTINWTLSGNFFLSRNYFHLIQRKDNYFLL